MAVWLFRKRRGRNCRGRHSASGSSKARRVANRSRRRRAARAAPFPSREAGLCGNESAVRYQRGIRTRQVPSGSQSHSVRRSAIGHGFVRHYFARADVRRRASCRSGAPREAPRLGCCNPLALRRTSDPCHSRDRRAGRAHACERGSAGPSRRGDRCSHSRFRRVVCGLCRHAQYERFRTAGNRTINPRTD